ncbi:uncharacterized protein RCC_03543 [Ramularia collo-cygni]|uniref:PEBP-like protein n=1 Tax=Ramularia collo-cygni TaxID=112498 RepID=A0A2D3V2F1_9PEZI|nr:uncharacterized protein RCC_03543 [Ramularia collo-cygni]CZT17706.1 uncharacterized protein RCC_03543 [Ramularia collo-cygni]
MRLLSLLSLTLVASAASIGERANCDIHASTAEFATSRRALVDARLVPETPAQFQPTGSNVNLIPSFNPTALLNVTYGQKIVRLGNSFSTLETVQAPSITFTAEQGHDPFTTKYTIIMADPDAPDPALPILGSALHEIISDAQPECVTSQMRKEVASYKSPTPLGLPPHRYTFLVYRQPAGYVPPAENQALLFNVTQYATEHGLQGPVAGNFFREGLGNLLD